MRRLAFPVAALCGLALAVVPALARDNQSVGTNGNRFVPDKVAVKPGEKVTISNTNGGAGPHDVVWTDGAPGYGPANQSPWTHERTFPNAGTYVFYCSVHGSPSSGMRGTVHVNDAGTVPSGGGGGTTTGGGGTTTQTQPPPTTTTGTTTSTTPGTNPLPPPPPDEEGAPRVSNARAAASRRRVVVRMTVSEDATVNLRLFRGVRRVARRTYEVEAGRVTLRLRLRRALRPGRYRVRLVLVDAAGDRATRTLSARVR
ncbi:MAG TPA: plastocyanin/azurin family copper-binding protein [Solirubrobacteraceae bacterium]|nr:plastocyanin/azurin family copper-binding protein [Solirubrobacteraceae bacterium]